MSRNRGRVLWDALCAQVLQDDGLGEFTSKGSWTAQKLFFVCQYLEQVTTAMTGNPGFPDGLVYIDLFAGSGVSAVEAPGTRPRRYPGSALIAASTPKPFDRLILVEADQSRLGALKQRIGAMRAEEGLYFIHGDVNLMADRIIALIPPRALNIAFIDPYSLDIHLDTIRTLARNRPLDLIILFSDRFDLGRNVLHYYYPDTELGKLDRFLGTSDWRPQLDSLDDQSGNKVRALFAEFYLKQLKQLGYAHSQSWPIDGPNGPAFRMVYASKNPLGLKFCDIALRESLGRERGLFDVT